MRLAGLLPAPRGRRPGAGPKRGRKAKGSKCGPQISGCVLVREYWRRAGKNVSGTFRVIVAEGGGKYESEGKVFHNRNQALQHRDILRAGGIDAKVVDGKGSEVA